MRLIVENVFHSLLLWILILGACTPSLPPADTMSALTTTVTPAPPPSGAYGYHQDLTQLSAEFQNVIQGLQAGANAHAFGKDCIHADGSRIFLAMETDFKSPCKSRTLPTKRNSANGSSTSCKSS